MNIETINLTKRFGSLTAVDHISFKVNDGEIFGFLGPNGAGKTTAIRMICGMLRADEGEVLFNGRRLNQNPTGKQVIGLCPQENIHWDRLTCHEQMVFVARMYDKKGIEARSRSKELLAELGLTDQASRQARKLSGGMKRRLNIALALVHDPKVLILDEPEAGLDPQSRVLMRDFVRKLSGSKTIILTTHNMDEADRLSDRIAIIDQGRIIRSDAPGKLKGSLGVATLEDVFIQLTGKQLRNP